MPIQRKNFIGSIDHAQMLVRVCTENDMFRQKLISLLSLPLENRRMIIAAWIESLKEGNSRPDLVKSLEMLDDKEKCNAILDELLKIDA